MKPLIPKKNNDDKPMVLWVWIINSLLDVKLAEMIEWVSSEGDGVFRIKKPKLLSREWTIYKSSFTKKKYKKNEGDIISRALRTYYGKGIIEKYNKTNMYRIINLQSLVGYTSIELIEIVYGKNKETKN